jgi:prepilin-type N-terminal cleavage/methylation domain-containing protein
MRDRDGNDKGSGMESGRGGFTLIEMSIVLVIIGLIVGGVLVGQDLIRAAYIRAQISQIEKFNTAVNTFYGKYQALPGDMNSQMAQQYNFPARDGTAGMGDGNGIIEGWNYSCGASAGTPWDFNTGEESMFWRDLAFAGIVEGAYPYGNCSCNSPNSGGPFTSNFGLWLPEAKLGQGQYIAAFGMNGVNYFVLEQVTQIVSVGGGGGLMGAPALPVMAAYRIDQKTDDGYPQSGRVIARYLDYGWMWAAGNGHYGTNTNGVDPAIGGAQGDPTTTATPATSYTCYDNGNTGGAIEQYSVATNSGATGNCTLSFRMQGGD